MIYSTQPNATWNEANHLANYALSTVPCRIIPALGNYFKVITTVVNDRLTVDLKVNGGVTTNLFNELVIANFSTVLPIGRRVQLVSASIVENATINLQLHAYTYYELYEATYTTTTTAAVSTTGSATVTTMWPTTIEMVEETSYYSKVTGNFSVDGNITLPDGTVLTSDPWPEVLNNPNSPEFASLKQVMAPGLVYLYESTGLYSQVSVNITGFRYGSIISDYVVALRSLTSLTAEQIKEKVKEKIALLGSSMLQNLPGFNSATVKDFNVFSVKTLSIPKTTTPADATKSSNASGLVAFSLYHLAIGVVTLAIVI